ncbi:MAG: hypothetical protein SGI73_10375 [Chloroflexota bacterium]|nr:hypothetical protein [Chloroflexota bacterium]
MITILMHIANAEAVKLDLEEMPSVTDIAVVGKNPRDRADREVSWLEEGVTTIVFPWWRITFLEILPSEAEEEEFPLPFRND